MGDLLYQYENIEIGDRGFYATDHGIQEPVSLLLLVYSALKIISRNFSNGSWILVILLLLYSIVMVNISFDLRHFKTRKQRRKDSYFL